MYFCTFTWARFWMYGEFYNVVLVLNSLCFFHQCQHNKAWCNSSSKVIKKYCKYVKRCILLQQYPLWFCPSKNTVKKGGIFLNTVNIWRCFTSFVTDERVSKERVSCFPINLVWQNRKSHIYFVMSHIEYKAKSNIIIIIIIITSFQTQGSR